MSTFLDELIICNKLCTIKLVQVQNFQFVAPFFEEIQIFNLFCPNLGSVMSQHGIKIYEFLNTKISNEFCTLKLVQVQNFQFVAAFLEEIQILALFCPNLGSVTSQHEVKIYEFLKTKISNEFYTLNLVYAFMPLFPLLSQFWLIDLTVGGQNSLKSDFIYEFYVLSVF